MGKRVYLASAKIDPCVSALITIVTDNHSNAVIWSVSLLSIGVTRGIPRWSKDPVLWIHIRAKYRRPMSVLREVPRWCTKPVASGAIPPFHSADLSPAC